MTTEHIPAEQKYLPLPLANQIEELFIRAEPRLHRLVRSQQVAPDAVADIVQETLLEAWKSLDQLRDETRFAAWLDGICRNMCYRHQRRQGVLAARETILASDHGEETPEIFAHLADPSTFDPTEELSRRDLAFLLDRALSYLTPESRAMVEQHYLAEIPQRELATRMGLTLSALEARLHRTRKQMLHVLGHDLRTEAIALGLAIDPSDATDWRKTQIGCIFCGKHFMSGIFEPMADGRVNLRLRCPSCMAGEMSSVGLVDLTQARSFLPAVKRTVHEAGRYFTAAMAAGGHCHCWICHRPARLSIVRDDTFAPQIGPQTLLYSDCPCGCFCSTAISASLYHPQVRDFIFGSSRVVLLPEEEATYLGQPAIRFGLMDLAAGRRLYIFTDAHTLQLFEVVAA